MQWSKAADRSTGATDQLITHARPDDGNEQHVFAFNKEQRRQNGAPATCGALETFKQRLAVFSEGSLSALTADDWQNVLAAGVWTSHIALVNELTRTHRRERPRAASSAPNRARRLAKSQTAAQVLPPRHLSIERHRSLHPWSRREASPREDGRHLSTCLRSRAMGRYGRPNEARLHHRQPVVRSCDCFDDRY